MLLRATSVPLKIVSPETCKFLCQEFGVDGDQDCRIFCNDKLEQMLAIEGNFALELAQEPRIEIFFTSNVESNSWAR